MKIGPLLTALVIIVSLAISDQAEALDITKSIEGTVKEIKVNSIKILSNVNSRPVPISIGPNTVYDNVQELTDLKNGDKVQIDYQINQSENTAITVTKMEVEGG